MKKQYPFAIKDWKKPEQYPDSNAMSKQELAWEFIRRNPDYQSNYDDLKFIVTGHPRFDLLKAKYHAIYNKEFKS